MSSEDQFIEKEKQAPQDYNNPLAWGKSKENFYKESQDEYSSVGEEEKQAEEIYRKHLQGLDDEDFMLHKPVLEEEDIGEDAVIDYSKQIKLLKQQIKKVLKHARGIASLMKVKALENMHKKGSMSFLSCSHSINEAYVMTLLMLLEMYQNGVLQINKHPIMDTLVGLREVYIKAKKQYKKMEPTIMAVLKDQIDNQVVDVEENESNDQVEQKIAKKQPKKSKQAKANGKYRKVIENYLDDKEPQQPIPSLLQDKRPSLSQKEWHNENEQDFELGKEGDEEIEDGLNKYTREVERQHNLRKKIKKEKKEQFLKSLPKEAFDKVRQNQARSINYTILKNRGLTRRRKNQPKSSKVKLRKKFEKAQIKQRGLGKVHYENPGRVYEGQQNIKSGMLRGTKLK